MDTQDKRRRTRINIDLGVLVEQNDISRALKTQNMSLKGLLAQYHPEVVAGLPCSVTILLSSGIKIHIQGIVVTSQPDHGTSIDFIQIDESSFYHLFNLIRFYAKDPDQIKREILNPAFDESRLELIKK